MRRPTCRPVRGLLRGAARHGAQPHAGGAAGPGRRPAPHRRQGASDDLRRMEAGSVSEGREYCSVVTTDEARTIVGWLRGAGIQQGDSTYVLNYSFEVRTTTSQPDPPKAGIKIRARTSRRPVDLLGMWVSTRVVGWVETRLSAVGRTHRSSRDMGGRARPSERHKRSRSGHQQRLAVTLDESHAGEVTQLATSLVDGPG